MNKAMVIGRLGADPDVRFMPDGNCVANMRVATDESYKGENGDKVPRTEWHRIVAYGKLATIIAEHYKTGRLVFVEGKLRTRKWTDQNKIDRFTTEVVAFNAQLLDRKKEDDQESSQERPQESADLTPINDVPF